MVEMCTEMDLRFIDGDKEHNIKAEKLHQKIKRMNGKWRDSLPRLFYLATKPSNGVCVYENTEGLIKFFERDYIPGKLIGCLFKKNKASWEVKCNN